jgi:plastocyanin
MPTGSRRRPESTNLLTVACRITGDVLNRADRAKRVGLVSGFVAAVALLGAGFAFGAAPIIGDATNHYSASTYTSDQGQVVQFQVTGSTHNVTAHQPGPDGGALFRTPTISGGTAGVNGTQYLPAGDYTFFCSIHPSTMQATLHITSNGTPQARPHADLRVRSRKISKVTKKGLLVAIDTSTEIDAVALTAKLGKTTIGTVAGLSVGSGQQFELLKLSKAGKSKLRRKQKATVTVTADIPFGSPATAKGKLT